MGITGLPADGHFFLAWGKESVWLEDKHCSLAFLGELYNTADLERSLGAGHGLPLARLLLLAQKRWPGDFIRRLDGQFVLAWRDGRALHLHRDASGVHNIYHTQLLDGGFAFATRLDVLLGLPGVQRRLARHSLHEYLRFLDISAPNTIYENIYALEAGAQLTWSGGDPRVEQIDHMPQSGASELGFATAVDTVEALLRGSIEKRLAGAARPAAFLSGGVDSSLICALAAGRQPGITAVTVGFEGANYDETPIAAQVAAQLGIPHEIFRYDRKAYIQACADFLHGAEQPIADPALPPTLLVFRDCQARFDVVLDGSGADEAVGLLPPRHIRVATEYAALLPGWLRTALARSLRPLPGLGGYAPIFEFEHPAELATRWHGFGRREQERLCGEPVSFNHTRFYRTFATFPRHAHFERATALLDIMPGDRLFQGAMLTGLCLRYPFWDRSTDEFLRALPLDHRHQPGLPKRILRSVLARHVPRNIWDLPKHGFNFPLDRFLAEEDFRLVRLYLRVELWRDLGILCPEVVNQFGERYIAGDQSLLFRVWALVALAIWLEAHAP